MRSEPPKIKTRDTVTGALSGDSTALPAGNRPGTPDRLSIKTREACIQGQPAPEQPPQAFKQGRQEFVRERGRAAAMKQEAQRVANGKETASPPASSRRKYAGGQGRHTPTQAVRRPPSPGEPDTRPVREGGRTIIKTSRSGRKTAERTARQTIKTAERSSRKAIKTTQRTAKTAQQTVKTAQRSAQATVKATQRAVQTARATTKAAAATAKGAAKATVAAIKAAISCIEEIYKKYVAEAREQHPEMFLQSKYTPHTMRHTTATHMLEAGVPLMAIKNFLGHASVATTESNSISNQEDICQGYFHPKNAMFPFP